MVRRGRGPAHILVADFDRPDRGWILAEGSRVDDVKLSGKPAWVSNGGPARGHPYRSNPFSLDIDVPMGVGELQRIELVGVLALWADSANEATGTLGASITFYDREQIVHRVDLLNGRHYSDPFHPSPLPIVNGDGTGVEPFCHTEADGEAYAVTRLSIDVPDHLNVNHIKFRDMGSVASFVVFDVLMHVESAAGCPFHSKRGGVSLSELGSIVRLGDRFRLNKAISQLQESLVTATELDEARGQALTFLAVLTAATLELGASKSMHRIQLDAARRFETMSNVQEIAECAVQLSEEVVGSILRDNGSPSGHLVDRALMLIERNFAKQLTDLEIAQQLGLSTSHFRFLFKETTGQPFHKYLIALRLERAKKLLVEQGLQVSEVAAAVGFASASHFSRAFSQRFKVSPTRIRQITG